MPQIWRCFTIAVLSLLCVNEIKSEDYVNPDNISEQSFVEDNQFLHRNPTESKKRAFGIIPPSIITNQGNKYISLSKNTNSANQNLKTYVNSNRRPVNNNQIPSFYRARLKDVPLSGGESNITYPQQNSYTKEALNSREFMSSEEPSWKDSEPLRTNPIEDEKRTFGVIARPTPPKKGNQYGSPSTSSNRPNQNTNANVYNHRRPVNNNQSTAFVYRPKPKEVTLSRAPYPQQAPYPKEASYSKEIPSSDHVLAGNEILAENSPVVASDINVRRAIPYENDHIRRIYGSKIHVPNSIKVLNEQFRTSIDSKHRENESISSEKSNLLKPTYSKVQSPLVEQLLSNDVYSPSYSYMYNAPGKYYDKEPKVSNDDFSAAFQPLIYLPWWLQPENKQYSPFSPENTDSNPEINRNVQPTASAWWLDPNYRPFSNSNQSHLVDINRQSLPSPHLWSLQPGYQPSSSSFEPNVDPTINRQIGLPVSPPWWIQPSQQFSSDPRGEPLFSPPAGGGPSSGFNIEVSEIGDSAFIIPETVEKVDVTIPPPFAPLRTHGLTISEADLSRSEVRKDNGEFISSFTSSDGTSRSDYGSLVPTADGKDEVLVLKGSYSFTTPEGLKFRVDYTADETGYHAKQYPVELV